MNGLSANRAAARAKAAADAEAALRLPRPRNRIDAGLGLVLIAAVLGFGGLGWVGANQIRAAGWLTPPLMSEVVDPRILHDYRDNSSPMVDLLVADADLLIGRENGTLDRFSLTRRTFTTEALPRDGRLSGDLALLSVPCAGDDCAHAGDVHAVTDRGGIAVRRGTHWEVLLADASFIGADGQPVEQADVRGWATSDSGELVLLNAGAQGIGLFDQRDGSWRTASAFSGDVQGPLFFGDAFWIGTEDGLYRLDPTAPMLVPSTPLPAVEGRILSLALSESDGLLVLRQHVCVDGSLGCLALLRIRRSGSAETLMAEVETNPDLNDSGLFHVAMQSGNLVTIGDVGVHRYDASARNWRVIDPQTPTAWFAETDGHRVHVAFPDRVVTFEDAEAGAGVRIDSPLVQILPGDGNDLFGLDRAGRIVLLTPPEAQVLAAADAGAPEGMEFTSALRLGNRLVAIGQGGVLVHEMIERRYSFTPASALPPMPPADALLRQGDTDSFWAISRTDGAVWRMAFDGEFPALAFEVDLLGELGGAVVEARSSGSNLDLIAASGQVYRLAPDDSGLQPLMGPPLAGSLTPRAMAATGGALLFTEGRSIWRYDEHQRGWSPPMPGPAGTELVDIAMISDRIVGLAEDGRLWAVGEKGGWSRVSGGSEGAAFASAETTDALMVGDTLYLAADGQVQAYHPTERRFGESWQARGNGSRLLGVDDGAPVWTTSAGIFHGDEPIFTPDGFRGAWAGRTGPVALVERNGRMHAVDSGGCVYLGVTPPEGTPQDVVELGENRLLVRTDRGAGIYEPDLHRWLNVTGLDAGAQSRLLILSGHLVQIDRDAMRSVPLSAIRVGGSCDLSTIEIGWTVTMSGRSASLVDGAPEVLVLGQDGALNRWRTGAMEQLAPPTGAGPPLDQALRAYHAADHLEILTADALWTYDLSRRVWSQRAFVGAPQLITQIDMQHGGAGLVVSAWDGDGQLWAGFEDALSGHIRFAHVSLPILPVLPFPAGDLRDMTVIRDEIVVLGGRQLLIYRKGETKARLEIALPDAIDRWRLQVDQTGSVLLVEGSELAPNAIHRLDIGQSGKRVLSDVAATYRLRDDHAHAFTIEAGEVELIRIDAQLATWRCGLSVGHEPACDLLSSPPLALAPEQVRAWDKNTSVLLTDTELLRLDDASRLTAAIDGPEVSPDGVLFRNEGALVFWEGPGRALWHIAGEDAERIVAQVDVLRQSSGHIQVLADGKVLGVSGAAIISDALPEQAGHATATASHFIKSGMVWRLDDGRVMALNGALVSDPVLDFADDARSILPLGRAPEGALQWWLLETADGSLVRIAATGCGDPEIGPPPPPERAFDPTVPLVPVSGESRCKTELPLGTLAPGERILDIDLRDDDIFIITNHHIWRLEGDALVDAQPVPDHTTSLRLAGADHRHPFGVVGGVSYLNPPAIRDAELRGGAKIRSLELLLVEQPPAFDNGWLAWSRESRQFRLESRGESRMLSPAEAFPDGRFRALHEGRGAMLGNGESSAWLNPFGFWIFQGEHLTLADESVRGTPEALDDGHFFLGDTGISATDGAASPRSQLRRITAGPLSFEITTTPMQIAATIEVGGQRIPAAARHGFVHDVRMGVAQSGRDAVYLTPAGLIPVEQLGPMRGLPAAGIRIDAEAGQIFLQTSSGWQQSLAGSNNWSAGVAPFRNHELARESGRVWSRRDGEVVVEAENSSEAWRIARQGLDFDIDRLVGFAATPVQAVAVTPAGTAAAIDLEGLRGVRPPLTPAPSGMRLDALRSGPARHVLFSRAADGVESIWDVDAASWRPPQPRERAWNDRTAVADNGLTLSFRPQAQMAVQVTEADGSDLPLPFTWARGEEMPFDRVTAIYSDSAGPDLLVGTRLGLRRLALRGSRFSNEALAIPAGAQPAGLAVIAVGRPEATPSRIEATFAGGSCLTAEKAGQPLRPCQSVHGLNRRFISASDRWQWVQTPHGVEGWYLLADGSHLPVSQPFIGGLPHDLLADRLVCGGTAFEQWRGTDVVLAGSRQIALPGVRRLFCQSEAAQLGAGTVLSPGLYAQVLDGAARFDGAGFSPTSSAEAHGIDDRVSGRVIADHGRLRYGLSGGLLAAEVRSLDDVWRPAAWSGGRLLLDQPRSLAFRDGLQSVTPAGVVALTRGRLDPARLIVMNGADARDIADCDPGKVETLDGRAHGVDRADGAPLRLYCRDGSWLQGIADGRRDRGAFAPVKSITSVRTLVDVPEIWSITQTIAPAGDSSATVIRFRDEPVRLAAGRFDFDMLETIAAPFAGQTELLTASGWWRAPAGVPLLADTRRAAKALDPGAVVAISRDLSPRDESVGLCVMTEGGDARFWDGTGAPVAAPTCRELRGRDPIWRWWRVGDRPLANTIALNDVPLERKLVEGRFSDLVANGAPMSASDGTLLAPTSVGILRFPHGGRQAEGIYAFADNGALARSRTGEVLWVSREGVSSLTGRSVPAVPQDLRCEGLATLAMSLPETARMLRVQDAEPGHAAVSFVDGPRVLQALVDCATGDAQPWASQHEVAEHPRGLGIGNDAPDLVRVSLRDGAIHLHDHSRTFASPMSLHDFRGYVTRPDQYEVLVIDDRQLWSIDLGRAIELLSTAVPNLLPAALETSPRPAARREAPVVKVPTEEALLQDTSPDVRPTDTAPSDLTPAATGLSAQRDDEASFDVREVQQALVASHGAQLVVDGIIGARTRAAIAAWQATIGAEETGYLSAAQLSLLLGQEP